MGSEGWVWRDMYKVLGKQDLSEEVLQLQLSQGGKVKEQRAQPWKETGCNYDSIY